MRRGRLDVLFVLAYLKSELYKCKYRRNIEEGEAPGHLIDNKLFLLINKFKLPSVLSLGFRRQIILGRLVGESPLMFLAPTWSVFKV